jgi:ABC-type transporter Mla MlaB component
MVRSDDAGAVAVRPGEHACVRLAETADRARVAAGFMLDGIARGNRVVYLCDDDDPGTFARDLVRRDPRIAAAHAAGQVELRVARDVYMPDGRFDPGRMIEFGARERRASLDAGHRGLWIAGDMTWAVDDSDAVGALVRYERALDRTLGDPSMINLCLYDPSRFENGLLTEIAAAHAVDVAPELAPIGRLGRLAAARTNGALRLAGDLDFVSAEALADVLEVHFPGPLEVDLAGLRFVDVIGMRALRGRRGRQLTIVDASSVVRRLVELLAWSGDPGITVSPAVPSP